MVGEIYEADYLPDILGKPLGFRPSLFVNQHAGLHMRRILEAMNASGMFGPVLESLLNMLSPKKRDAIALTLIRAAVDSGDGKSPSFDFELRGKTCRVGIHDTWDDCMELSIRVEIGQQDLYVTGFHYPEDGKITRTDPIGKRAVAAKSFSSVVTGIASPAASANSSQPPLTLCCNPLE